MLDNVIKGHRLLDNVIKGHRMLDNVIKGHRMLDNVMVKRTNNDLQNITQNYRLTSTIPTTNGMGTQVLRKGNQFLLH
jgi:hypothetical protein